MRRDQLEHAIRTACQIIGRPDVIAVGSRAILAPTAKMNSPARPPCRAKSISSRSPIATKKPCSLATASKGWPGALALRAASWFQY